MALGLDFPSRPPAPSEACPAPSTDAGGRSWAHERGLPLRSTPRCAATPHRTSKMAAFVATLGIVFWEVFFLIPVGRAAFFRACPPPVQLFDLIYRTQKNSQFIVKVTGHHRRHVAQRERCWRAAGRTQGSVAMPGMLTQSKAPGTPLVSRPWRQLGKRLPLRVASGRHLPQRLSAALGENVRQRSLADAYRRSPLHASPRSRHPGWPLRPLQFRTICGGSRSQPSL